MAFAPAFRGEEKRMDVRIESPRPAVPRGAHGQRSAQDPSLLTPSARIVALLGGEQAGFEAPPLLELASALTTIARGTRPKVLLPLPSAPLELALVRDGGDVLVSAYRTESIPALLQRDRRVGLGLLLSRTAAALRDVALAEQDAVGHQVSLRVAERAERAVAEMSPTSKRRRPRPATGSTSETAETAPLAFSWRAEFHPAADAARGVATRADVHATLFGGSLRAHVRGQRVDLAPGPLLPAIQRMLVGVRALIESRDAGRPVHLRLGDERFAFSVRSERPDDIELTFRGARGDGIRAAALDLGEAALPVLRLATDVLRALTQRDRAQSRNLRVRAIRDEVRALKRRVRGRERRQSFTNDDPDRLRASLPSAPPAPAGSPTSLRYREGWRLSLDGVDAADSFLAGDLLCVASTRHMVALERRSGEVRWARMHDGARGFLAGSTWVRVDDQGHLELCAIEDGEPFATGRVSPRAPGAPLGLGLHAEGLPPMAILAEDRGRLVGIDLRTAEPRFRHASRTQHPLRFVQAGRALVVASADGSVHAIDLGSGETAWRFSIDARFESRPVVSEGIVLVAGRGGVAGAGALYALDLYTGDLRYEVALDGPPERSPRVAAGRALVATRDDLGGTLHAFELHSGEPLWSCPDPGLASGASAHATSNHLYVNTPGGDLVRCRLEDGEIVERLRLSDVRVDDVPRSLTPLAAGDTLFVPSAGLHAFDAETGAREPLLLPSDLVPDRFFLDDEHHLYVLEESGEVVSYAPMPHLALVR